MVPIAAKQVEVSGIRQNLPLAASTSFTQFRSVTVTASVAQRMMGRHSKFSSHSADSEKDNTFSPEDLLVAASHVLLLA